MHAIAQHTIYRVLACSLALLLGAAPLARAQDADTIETDPRSASIEALARSTGNAVILRWAPSKPGAWIVANGIGYAIERRRITGEEDDVRSFERITTTPIRPWSIDEWKARSTPEQKYAAIAVQCLYGKSATPESLGEGVRGLRLAADELSNRFGFALFAADVDPHAADGLGLRFVDRNVRPGETWAYRIFLANPPADYALDTGWIVIDVTAPDPVPAPVDLAVEERDGSILLSWRNIDGIRFTAFNVERSDDRGGSYRRLNGTPLVPMTPEGAINEDQPRYLDTTVDNYQRYTYRVRGITPFGEESTPAEIEAMGRDLTPPPTPLLEKPLLPADNMATIRWELDEGDRGDLAGFVVARSAYPDQDFVQITPAPIPAGDRTFTDREASVDFPYYMVGSVDTAGNVAASLPVYVDLIDTIPPAQPRGLVGAIDSAGIVTLRWDLGSEPDLLGYRVLWANDSAHEFSQLTGDVLQDTLFTDTVQIRTLTPTVYYKVVAVDTRYIHSDATPVLELHRPDVVPPEASVFTDVFVTDTTVTLRWEPSRSEDVARQILYRRRSGESSWNELASIGGVERSFVDRDVQRTTTYEYRIVAVDDAGLRSEHAFAVKGRPYDSGKRAGVSDLRGTYDVDAKRVELSWEFEAIPEKHWFVIYRSHDGLPLRQYRAIESTERSFTDNLLIGSGRYVYAVRLVTPNGESELDDEVSVMVP